jgi:hypothetical protein
MIGECCSSIVMKFHLEIKTCRFDINSWSLFKSGDESLDNK